MAFRGALAGAAPIRQDPAVGSRIRRAALPPALASVARNAAGRLGVSSFEWTANHVAAAIGDAKTFFELQAERCGNLGIDVADFPISHVAHRSRTWREYVATRDDLERVASANVENVWNGRPISKLLLAQPLRVSERHDVDLVELIPPFHERVYRMGLEHIGFVVGDTFDPFVETHQPVLTGQQFQGPLSTPVYILFDDYTHVKFHRMSLADVCRVEGRPISGFQHVDWQPADELAGPYAVW